MNRHGKVQREREKATTLAPVQEVLSTGGQPLDTDTQSFMESRFGHDFSQVRVHTDEKAVQSAQTVNALAYTVGSDVVFGQGQYEPGTGEGKKLLAHELTHVVQQRNVNVDGGSLMVGSTKDRYEQEADTISRAIDTDSASLAYSTKTASNIETPGGLIQRQPSTTAKKNTGTTTEATMQLPPVVTLDEAAEKRANNNRYQADSIDREWENKFLAHIDNCGQAIELVGGAMNEALNKVKSVHEVQDKADELMTEVILGVFSASIGWMAGPAVLELGEISKTIVEASVQTFEAVAKDNKENNDQERVARSLDGKDALNYLTNNHQQLLSIQKGIHLAFADREVVKRNYTEEEWLNFDTAGQAASYKSLFEHLTATVKGMEGLKDPKSTSLIIEKNMWAKWICDNYLVQSVPEDTGDELIDTGDATEVHKYESLPGFGGYIEDRFNQIGIADLAGVTLTGHWYSPNSPDDWLTKLWSWATSYKESIGSIE